MKSKITLTVILALMSFSSIAQQPFITTWQSVFGSTSITFGTVTTGPVEYSWESLPPAAPASGSGTFQGSNVTISDLPGNQRIRLTIQPENFKRIFADGFSFTITEINQWGSVEWISMENAFNVQDLFFPNGIQLVNATDIPNLSSVANMSNMFAGNSQLNGPFNINFWNISNVTNLSGMFKGCLNFNQALSLWNTSNVTDMSSMFEGAHSFNQNIGNWNTSNVLNMSKMFKDAFDFNRNIGNWNTSNVTDMSEMFNCSIFNTLPSAFNQNIGNWNTANVTNMSGMFSGAIVFNQNIGNWNTSNVTNMSNMFNQAFSFNQNIGNWNTSSVTNMSGMFRSDLVGFTPTFATTSLFNNGGSNSIQNWNTTNVTDMSGMFFRAENFNKNLGNWNISAVQNLTEMLDRSGLDCRNYSQTLIGWNENPNTPNNLILGATFLEYGPEAIPAINNFVFNKGWGFSGHDFISTIPAFEFETSYCQGSTIPPLPITSIEGISGSWTPEINNTTTTTYSFIPNQGECATTAVVTIFITPNSEPTFTPVPPICAGQVLAALPTTSSNGFVGSWSPALNNTQTTTYTFTPNSGQCASMTTLTITVNPSVTPTFSSVSPICIGESLSPLPTTSSNGFVGSWSPALNNTQTTTYTFTPNSGQCASTSTLTITVNQIDTPSGDSNQTFSSTSTISDIIVSPSTVIWYATLADALANVNPLPTNLILENNTTYYAVNDNGVCRSEPFPVTVSISLNVLTNDFLNFVFYPNPVRSMLNISSNEVIKKVEVYTLLGQLIKSEIFNSETISIEMNDLANSIYLVKVKSVNSSKEFKISKQ
ncbi:MAG TPA: BspA family leucine-rich repeat surface protein [Flavobacterium sp.]|uniref:BspA family leucine-rich repeat surface protein n=1 Tax=unclassified Flavobacterium TaxID=196869 RepID=UPI000E828220|nr:MULTISPECIES: BspA family leucine-rich repeat surface protein [unclassified Flavobacterium]HBI00795.1 hypothetical protein [Flavobacterium sp.]HRE76505.1 BspA family leucine-rich repeat surface protein [Flavobacterium sp.]